MKIKLAIQGIIFVMGSILIMGKEGRAVSPSAAQAEKKLLLERKIKKAEENLIQKNLIKTSKTTASSAGEYSVQEARDFVELIGNKVVDLLQTKNISRDEQERRYGQILDDHFDMPRIARYTLGRYARKVNAEKFPEFQDLFTQVTIEHYVNQFRKYKNQTLQLSNREYRKGPYLIVSSYIKQPGQKNINIQWYIKKKPNGSLAVYEMKVEGVGIRETKRNIYDPTLRKGGIDLLIKNLKQELKNFNGLADQR